MLLLRGAFLLHERILSPVSPNQLAEQTSTLIDATTLQLLAEKHQHQLGIKRTEKKPSFFEKKLSKQPIQPFQYYLDRFFPQDVLLTTEQIKAQLAALRRAMVPDFEHAVREISVIEKKTSFPIKISVETESSKGEGYDESLTSMFANFAQVLAEQGLTTARSLLEKVVFSQVYEQLSQVGVAHFAEFQRTGKLPNTMVLVTSPPGDYASGYHGVDTDKNLNGKEHHHTFFFTHTITGYETTTDASGNTIVTNVLVEVAQWRTWHNMAGLLDLHAQLGQSIALDTSIPVMNQLIANVITLQPKHSQTTEQTEAALEKMLYLNQDRWVMNPDASPTFKRDDETRFWKELGFDRLRKELGLDCTNTHLSAELSFFEVFFLQPVERILQNTTPEALQDSTVRELITAQIELRAQLFLTAVEQRIRQLNTNPKYTELVKRNLWQAILTNPFQLPTILRQLADLEKNNDEPLNTSKAVHDRDHFYRLEEKRSIFRQKLSKKDLEWMASTGSSLFAFGGFAAGSMQCWTIGAIQLPLKMMRPDSLTLNMPELQAQLDQVDTLTKKKVLEEIKQTQYVELDLTKQGANQVWMVPASYLEKPGCRVNADGVVCGPCITDEYPNGIPLDHPLEKENPYGPLPMNQAQFESYVQTLEASILQDKLNQQLDTKNMNEQDARKTNQLIARLLKRLVRVSLSNLIAGVIEYQHTTALLPEPILQKITSITALERLVLFLEKIDLELVDLEKVLAIIEEDPSVSPTPSNIVVFPEPQTENCWKVTDNNDQENAATQKASPQFTYAA